MFVQLLHEDSINLPNVLLSKRNCFILERCPFMRQNGFSLLFNLDNFIATCITFSFKCGFCL